MFSLTEAHVVPSSAALTVQRGQETGLAAGLGAVDRDPPTPASSSLCLLACSVCYDPCCLGSGPSSEFGREQHPAEPPKAPSPQAARPHLCWANCFGAKPFPRTSCSSIGGPSRSRAWSLSGPSSCAWKASRAGRGGSCLGSVTWVVDGPGSHPGQLA